jgi:putative sigma-54 modulation protein
VEVSISTRHGSLSATTQEYIEKKLPKLSHLFERLTSIKVTVDFQRAEPEVELLVSAEHKHDFVSRERHAVVEAAFDTAIAKMEGQIRRYKERVQDHHRRQHGIEPERGLVAGEEG